MEVIYAIKTSSLEFERYGSVYDKPVSPGNSGMISRDLHLIAKRSLNQVYHFDCEVCLELQSGMAALVVGESLDTAKLEEFAVHRNVRLKPGLYWNLIAVTSNITCKMIATTDYSYSLDTLPSPYMFRGFFPACVSARFSAITTISGIRATPSRARLMAILS